MNNTTITWQQHLKKFREHHPDIAYKQALKQASLSYKQSKKGGDLFQSTLNTVLSTKKNKLLAGEKHGIIKTKDGKLNPAVYMGPNTNLSVRIPRKGIPLSHVDKISKAHDLRYSLAKSEQDIRDADLKMLSLLSKAKKNKLDSQFNILQAELIKTKIMLEKMGIPKSWFASWGGSPENMIELFRSELNKLEMQGFGLSG